MTLGALTGSTPWFVAGWTMLHFLWVGALAGLFAAVLRRALRHARPELRYTAALSCLAGTALAPVLIAAAVAGSGATANSSSTRFATPPVAAIPPSIHGPSSTPPPEIVPIEPRAAIRPRIDRLATALPWIWATGSPATFAWLALGLIGGERLRRKAQPLNDDVERLCRRLSESLGIARRVALGISERIATPILIGVVRPLILLPPVALKGWSAEQIEMVLLHELAHVRRFDNLVNLLQRVLESVLFFQPAVWWISAWVRAERELCCDRLVIAQTGRRRPSAQLLAALATPCPAPCVASAAAAHPVVDRIRRILEPEIPPMKLRRTAVACAAALTFLPTLWIGSSFPRLGKN